MARALILALLTALTSAATSLAADDEALDGDILITPFIGERISLVEAFLRAKGSYRSYLGAVAADNLFGGFADVDGDGRKDIVVVVDNDLACDESGCDAFVFAPIVANRSIDAACDWRLVDDRRKPLTRGLYERFVTLGDKLVALTQLPAEVKCRLDGMDWEDFFHLIYNTDFYLPSEKLHHRSLSDVRVGTYDVNGDGRDEVFIFIAPFPCLGCMGQGAIIETAPQMDGSRPEWHRIGKFDEPDIALTTRDGEPTFLAPSAVLRPIDETIDGYRTLCSSTTILRWTGETYVQHVYTNSDSLLEEARSLGCPGTLTPRGIDASAIGEASE